ncbi:alpha-ketoglutarate:H(+) symporter [Hyphomicrobium sp. 1Nfss2.1]|uniref:MFS transporter n=1 Tax=Hyphomicrobium sp. 1Nfss2.1 TaxID=3413936 RepID=UPI003C7D2F1B
MDHRAAGGAETATPETSLADTARRLKAIFVGSAGNLVEWFDFYAYSAFALYFAKSFFPTESPTAQLLNAAAIFAVGFLMRPFGGWMFGHIADRHGRRLSLTISVLMMCLGSLIIALTPTYATIGLAAPIVLLMARLIQGLSLGGEYGTSATYLSEVAHPDHRGFYSSFQYVTLIGGQLLAMLVLLSLQLFLLTSEQLDAWGWRIPFFIGAGLAVVIYFMRRDMHESEAFVAAGAAGVRESPIKGLLHHPREVAIVVGLTLGGTVAFYTYTTYMQKFLVNSVGLPKETSTIIAAATLFLYMCLQPIVGAISDVVGRRPVLLSFGVLGTLMTVPILTTLQNTDSAWTAFFLIMAALVIVSGYTAINAVVKAELFPTSVRAMGVGFPYAVTVALFGGTAEYVALYLKEIGYEHAFYWYVTGCIAISLAVYALMRDTRDASAMDRHV